MDPLATLLFKYLLNWMDLACAFNPSTCLGRKRREDIGEIYASLVYRVSSRQTRVVQWDPILTNRYLLNWQDTSETLAQKERTCKINQVLLGLKASEGEGAKVTYKKIDNWMSEVRAEKLLSFREGTRTNHSNNVEEQNYKECWFNYPWVLFMAILNVNFLFPVWGPD